MGKTFILMDDGKKSLPVLPSVSCFIYCTPRAVLPCVTVLHVPSIHSPNCFCSSCEVGSSVRLPCRRTHQGQEHLNKG